MPRKFYVRRGSALGSGGVFIFYFPKTTEYILLSLDHSPGLVCDIRNSRKVSEQNVITHSACL